MRGGAPLSIHSKLHLSQKYSINYYYCDSSCEMIERKCMYTCAAVTAIRILKCQHMLWCVQAVQRMPLRCLHVPTSNYRHEENCCNRCVNDSTRLQLCCNLQFDCSTAGSSPSRDKTQRERGREKEVGFGFSRLNYIWLEVHGRLLSLF